MKRFAILRGIALVSVGILTACGASRQQGFDRQMQQEQGNEQVILAKADAAWKERGDKARLEAAIGLYEKASAVNPQNLTTLSRLARAYYFLADGHYIGEKEKQLPIYDKGAAAGERALGLDEHFRTSEDRYKKKVLITLDKKYVPAMYWTASCLGKWAKLQGFVSLLKVKGRVKALVETVSEKDPTYFYYAPDRYWGVYYAVAPGFAGGDMNKSREHFEKSIAGAPNYLGTKVLYADNWAGKKLNRKMYEKLLKEVLAVPDDIIPEITPENKAEKEKARRLLAPEVLEDRFE